MSEDSDALQPLSVGIFPVESVPRPVLLQDEENAYLVFDACLAASKSSCGMATLCLQNCLVTRFGYPNDEALHALLGSEVYPQGIGYYGVYEVRDSSWVMQLQEQRRQCCPDSAHVSHRHFVITFRDSTFEAIAQSVKVTVQNRRATLARFTHMLGWMVQGGRADSVPGEPPVVEEWFSAPCR
jgi:hypothetical protein